MSKVHITNEGEIKKCTAENGRCRYSKEHHFASVDSAQTYIKDEAIGSHLYKRLAGQDADYILKELHIRTKAKYTEFKAMIHSMEKNDNGDPRLYKLSNIESPNKQEEINKMLSIVMPGKSQKAVYLVGEDNNKWYVWTNSADMRDVVVVDKDITNYPLNELDKGTGKISHIEVKDLTTGAQLASTTLNHLGIIGLSTDNKAGTEKINELLSTWDPRAEAYTNRKLELSEDEAYDYLLNDYYYQDCQNLTFYSDKQKKFIEIPLTTDDKENNFENAKKTLRANNIDVEVRIRCNMSARGMKVTEEDKQMFKEHYGCMFKDGVVKDKFTIKDLQGGGHYDLKGVPNRAFIRKHKRILANSINPESNRPKAFIRLGNFMFESKDDLKDDTEYTLDDFMRIPPLLMGTIKERK